MAKCLSFGNVNSKFLIIFSVPIILTIRYVSLRILRLEKSNLVIELTPVFIGQSLVGMLWLYYSFINKDIGNLIKSATSITSESGQFINRTSISVEESDKLKDFVLISDDMKNKCQVEIDKEKRINNANYFEIKYILLISFLHFVGVVFESVLPYLFNYEGEVSKVKLINLSTIGGIKCIMFAIVTIILLPNTKMEKHQFLSIFVITILLVATFIYEMDGNFNLYAILSSFMNFSIVAYAFCFVLAKRYYNQTLSSPFKLITLDGIISIILLLITQFFFKYIPCYRKKGNSNYINDICFENKLASIYKNLENINFLRIFFFSLANIIIGFLYNISAYMLVALFSPNHLAMSSMIFSQILFFFIIDGTKVKYFFHIIIFLLILLFTFVFNEVIVFHFCSFDKETFDEIDQRAKSEADESLLSIIDIDVNVNDNHGINRRSRISRPSIEPSNIQQNNELNDIIEKDNI